MSRRVAIAAVFVVLLCSLHGAATAHTVMDIVPARGTHYEIGFQIGRAAQAMILRRLSFSDVTQWIVPFLATSDGSLFQETVMNATLGYYPEFIEEMRGTAAGANVTLQDMFILNAMAELQTVTNASMFLPTAKHCTDVISAPTPDRIFWGHNEDGSGGDRDTCFIVNVTVTDADHKTVLESFVAFAYYGTFGLAWAWNMNGVLFSVNSLSPNTMGSAAAPMSNAVGRRTYSSKSIDDTINTVAKGRGISGFNINVGSLWEHRVVSLEVDAFGKSVSAHETSFSASASTLNPTPLSYFYHANAYRVLSTSQPADPDSDTRIATLSHYPQPTSSLDVCTMLGDTSNQTYPVYRAEGDVETLSTVVFDVREATVKIFNANPSTNPPIYSWSLLL